MPAVRASAGKEKATTDDGGSPAGAKRRRAGRPSAAVLDLTGITQAALDLIGNKGYDGLTMAALARTLEVAPSALYNHVESKHDVLVLVEDHLMSLVDVSGFESGSWEEAVRTWAWSYRDAFAAHTPLIPVIAVLPVTDAPRTLLMYEVVSTGFRDAGIPEARIVPAIVALESFIFGSAYDVTAPAEIFDSGNMAGSTPGFTAAVRSLAEEQHERPADVAFSLGLEALIAGIGALRG
ncbi:TetR/AcrR family transcriptional regulator [Pseudarthrobacter sp. J75]|uniref:TetR/AcrR family transcriptional regulator n=1 Tax=unclassified Pseudarthrobacter TaxID=2647000 RepID=UPI002E80BBB2|nr:MULTISPECIES: TetR/AcrR family transcriptional regulator [unclassified Pseudarthrobacter]MEE2523757.1 TetR/AcrR family transcriptional regulator [Pseudarthrobacter sp. J47]MEE2529923.1 TetR/AcrR family transcriptional regulator [Pseudarthrobacter sp. J75]